MKVKVRTKQGGFRDDRFHFTTDWQTVDLSELSGTHIEHPNIEIKTSDGKLIPTPDPVPGTTLPRVAAEEPAPVVTPPESET